MKLLTIAGIIVGSVAAVIACFAVARHFQFKRESRTRELEYDSYSDTDSDYDSEDEDFQDLRHHRLMHEAHPAMTPEYQQAMLAYMQAQTEQAKLASENAKSQELFQYDYPAPPAKEEYNDIRIFYTTTLPVKLTNLDVENCVEVELLDAVIPRGDYVVHGRNQSFEIRQPFSQSLSTYTQITVPEGDYSASSLATAITSLIAAAGYTNFVAVTSQTKKNFTFRSDVPVDVRFNTELAYDLGWGTTETLNVGSVQFEVNGSSTYGLETAQQFEVSVDAGAFSTYTVPAGTYTSTELATAMTTAMATVPELQVEYITDKTRTFAFYHTNNASINVRLHTDFANLLESSKNTGNSTYDASTGRYTASSLRADLYGSRYVEIRTQELDGPGLHHRGVLQAAFLENEITNWRANGSDKLRRRRFQLPQSIKNLTISFKERHPSKSDEADFHDMELNGLAISMSICFRRLRYANDAQSDQLNRY